MLPIGYRWGSVREGWSFAAEGGPAVIFSEHEETVLGSSGFSYGTTSNSGGWVAGALLRKRLGRSVEVAIPVDLVYGAARDSLFSHWRLVTGATLALTVQRGIH